MQTFDISFRATSEATIESISVKFYQHFEGLIGQIAGQLTIQVFVEGSDGLDAVMAAVCALETMLSIRIHQIDPDLVDIPEIAARVGKSRQAVQQWVTRQDVADPFPVPLGSPGGKRIWAWRQVVEWLREFRPPLAQPELTLSRDDLIGLEYWLIGRRSMHGNLSGLASAGPILMLNGASLLPGNSGYISARVES